MTTKEKEEESVTVFIKLRGGLRSSLEGKSESFQLTVPKGSRLSEVLDRLGLSEREHLLVAVGGVLVDRIEEEEINADSSVSVFPPIEGG